MPRNDAKYWEKRALDRSEEYARRSEKTAKELESAYEKAYKQLNADAEHIMKTFQSAYGLSEKEATALLKNAKGKTANARLKKALENATDQDKARKIQAAIDAPAYKYRMARLEKVMENVDKTAHELYGAELRKTTSAYRALYDDAYMRTMFDIQSGTGLGFSFAAVDEKKIDAVLSRTWSKEHYSSRIWGHTKEMAQTVKDELLTGVLTGRSWERTAENIAQRCGVGAYEAKRLVRTEGTYVAGQAELDSYEEADIEKYEYLATLDTRTSDICAALDGKVFDCKDAKPGVNYPPMHPHCRSTTVAHMDDVVIDGLKRRARDPETGKTYLVPADMTYQQWQKAMDQKYDVGTVEKIRKMRYNKAADREQFERYKVLLGKNAPKTFADFQAIKYSDSYASIKVQYADARIQNRIKTGKVNITVLAGKQGKHIKGHNNFIEGRSYLNADEDVQAIVNKYAGTGTLLRDASGKWAHKEIVKADHPIGFAVSQVDGTATETTIFTIHYSKNGVHIVPKKE